MTTGPSDSGDDMERLLKDLQAKGWSPRKVQAAAETWEDACFDPMRRGRGGKGLPENEVPPTDPPPLSPIKPDPEELMQRTVSFPPGTAGTGGVQPPAN